MNKGKLIKILGEGNLVIPLYILKNFRKLDLEMDEFVFLMYLYNKENKLEFNPDKIGKELNMDIMEVMGYISLLGDKGYLTLDVLKSGDGVIEEVINLNPFYEKLNTILINMVALDEPKKEEDIFPFIEKQIGRPLNSLEISAVNGWLDNKVTEELIKKAFSIASDFGVSSIKYIDKLIFDWTKNGIKTVDDLEKQEKSKQESEPVDLDIGDWNWLDDEEEYIGN